MAITPLAALDRTSPTFRADVDTFFGSGLPNFVTESNAQAAEIIAAGLLSGGAIAAAAAAQEAAADALVAAAAVGVAVDWANNIFATGTRMPFAQPYAPTGWAQDVSDTADNRMLRVTKLTGGGVAGAHSPIQNTIVPSHLHGVSITSGTESVSHTHSITNNVRFNIGYDGAVDVISSDASSGDGIVETVTTGTQSQLHTHAVSGNTGSTGTATGWQPRYIDMIICSKS